MKHGHFDLKWPICCRTALGERVESVNAVITEQVPRLRRYARALTGDRMSADDLVQDTLERAWEKLHLWQRGSDMRAWMFSIMHNTFINHIKKKQLVTTSLDDDEALSVSTSATQEHSLEMRDLASSIGKLPYEYREVILLIGLEQMQYEEVAQVLDIPLGTVMSRLSRGRERLRTIMAGENAPALRRVK
jgi:RNA polymerase sigma-70 factor (ECF subfamily)